MTDRDTLLALKTAIEGLLPFAKTMTCMEDCPYPAVLEKRIAEAETALRALAMQEQADG